MPTCSKGNVILLRKEAVEQFEPYLKEPVQIRFAMRIYHDGSSVIATAMQVQVGAAKQMQLLEKLQEIYKGQNHTFPGTIYRYIFKDNTSPKSVSIWLILNVTEMLVEVGP